MFKKYRVLSRVCPASSGGWQPGLNAALTWIPAPGTCLWADKNAPSVWLLSSSCGMQLPPRAQVPGQGRGLPVRGKALTLAALARVLAALGASVQPRSMHAGTAGGLGGMWGRGGTLRLWRP